MRDWKSTVPLLVVLLSLAHCSTCAKTPLNSAAAFAWRGYADTNLSLSSLGNEYTIAFRFMLQYPNSYAAPIISDSATGNFYVAKDTETSQLVVNFNGTQRTFKNEPLDGKVWHHVAVTRKNATFRVYHDGKEICPDPQPCGIPAGSAAATGVLRLARIADTATIDDHEAQFYGFIDDVAVFKKALTESDIADLATSRLDGSESDLFAGYSFDNLTPSGAALPEVLKGTVTFEKITPGTVLPHMPAFKSLVSEKHDSAFDAKLLPPPFQQVEMQLPFPAKEAWFVLQGNDDAGGSHNGAASFSWDFTLAGKPQSETEGKPIFAAAAGKAVETRNDRDSCSGFPSSYAMVEQAPEEIAGYLHFVMGSVEVNTNDAVTTGQKLGKAGDTGNVAQCDAFHLHFSLYPVPESQAATLVTFPAAFSNYEVSTDDGQTWTLVKRGIPQQGEWVRNP